MPFGGGCYGSPWMTGITEEARKADARLIAAAPDLLEALKMWMKLHESPAGYEGKYGKALTAAIEAQQVRIDAAAAASRADEAGVRREIRAWTPEEMLAHREEYAAARVAQAVKKEAESRRAAQAQVAQLQERIARAGIEQQRAVREAVAQERARAIPAGWRLAPEEATQAMVNEALSAVLTSPAGYAEIYRAMVNAAPQPPSAPPPSAGEETDR